MQAHHITGSRWLKNELEILRYNVWLPQLPHSQRPSTKIYNDFLLSNKDFQFGNETIIVGHSSGAVEALSLLEHINCSIKSAFLVSAFKDWLGWDSLKDLFATELDFETIKKKADNFVFIHSDNDPYCPIDHPKYLAKKVDGEIIIMDGQGHFNTELGEQYKQFPKLLEIIRQYDNSSTA